MGMSGSWTTMASKWKWKDRAVAWDNQMKQPLDEDLRRASQELMEHVNQSIKHYYAKLVKRLKDFDPAEIPAGLVGPQLLAFTKALKEIHGAATVPLAGDEEVPLADVDVRALAVQRRRDAQQLERFKTDRGLSVTPQPKILMVGGGSSRVLLGNGNTVPAPTKDSNGNGSAKIDTNPRAALTPRVKNRAIEGNGNGV